MHAHQPVAARPVDVQHELLADRRRGRAADRHVSDDVLGRAMPGFDDVDAAAVFALEETRVSGCPPDVA